MYLYVGAATALLAACAGEAAVATDGPTADAPDYDAVFATDRVHRLALRMDASDHDALMDEMEALLGAPFGSGELAPADVRPDDAPPVWYPVTVEAGALTWEGAGFRLKGNSTLRGAWQRGIRKLPFRLDIDRHVGGGVGSEGQRFFGFEELSFSNGYRDATLMRDVLASEILADRGVPAARAAYWWVTLDTGAGPEPLGLYVALELPEDTLVERIWGEDGALYKPEGACATLACFDEASFEVKSDDAAADWSDVRALHDALDGDRSDPAAWRARLEATLDVDGFLRWLAVNTALRNWDAYGVMAHNYYLYGSPADGGRLTWIPWDHNEAISDRPSSFDDPLLRSIGAEWPLVRHLLDDPLYDRAYRAHLLDALDGAYAAEAFDARVEALAALLRPVLYEGEGEPADATFLGTEAEFDDAIQVGLVGLAETRRRTVATAAAED